MINKAILKVIKTLRKFYKYFSKNSNLPPSCVQDPNIASQLIINKLLDPNPCMIARFGAFELNTIVTYLGITKYQGNYLNYIIGKAPNFWWEPKLINSLKNNAGFFPTNEKNINRFCELMLNDISYLDILGSWLYEEKYIENKLMYIPKIFLLLLDPFWSKIPWTKVLEGKKVLVIHPFAKTIEKQYIKRKYLHNKVDILPDFELKILKAVQSNAGEKTTFKDWFEALDYMKLEINKIDFEICLIGAGAYGFPLAAHVKRMGKKAVHIGGSLQLLFGIKGRRWEDPNYNSNYNYFELMNNYWIKPSEIETPKNSNLVEGACYW